MDEHGRPIPQQTGNLQVFYAAFLQGSPGEYQSSP